MTSHDHDLDCLVVGGGAAGLNAALALGRASRRTLVVDAGGQSNLPAHAIGGLLGQHDVSPAELYATGRRQLAEHPAVAVRDTDVSSLRRADPEQGGFAATLADGTAVTAAKVVLATGADYPVQPLDGADALWGDKLFHCPFCHGWEARGDAVGVIAPPGAALHAGLMMRLWAPDVVLLGAADVDEEDRARLEAAGVGLEDRAVAGLQVEGDRLAAVVLDDGSTLARTALFAGGVPRPRNGLALALGASVDEHGRVVVDAFGATDVPGLHAAGDLVAAMPSVAAALLSGMAAAAGAISALAFAQAPARTAAAG